MIGLILLLQVAATQGDVVVTARRDAAAAALRACLARQCSPREDVAATLAFAERQVENGDYNGARSTLRYALGRNRRFAKTEPVLVAALWRADSRLAVHVGDVNAYRDSQLAAVGTLRSVYGPADRRVLDERLAVGDGFGHLGDYRAAAAQYREVAADADRAEQLNVRTRARLRLANLYVMLAMDRPAVFTAAARRAIEELRNDDGPSAGVLHQAADVYAARMALAQGDETAVNRLIAASRSAAGSEPILVYAPAVIPPRTTSASEQGMAVGTAFGGSFAEQWIDVAFQVNEDGSVESPTILRNSKTFDRAWAQPVLAAIAGRRYAPDRGGYRVERYTRTARLVPVTGSRLLGREPIPRIEMLDLTKGPPAAALPEG